MSLAEFVKRAWTQLEPGQPYFHNWHIDYICLPGHVIVQTRKGPRAIGDIVESGWEGEVLSFNHATNKPEWRRIVARMKNPGRPLYTITTKDVSVPMTGNHPVFVAGTGYTPAALIKRGHRVIQLQAVWDAIQSRAGEDCGGNLLQPSMLCGGAVQAGNTSLFAVWRRKGAKCQKRLLDLPSSHITKRASRAVPTLWRACVVNAIEAARVLQPQMHRIAPAGISKPGVRGWQSTGSVSDGVQSGKSESAGARGAYVFHLLRDWIFGRTPHRQRSNQQRIVELSSSVPDVSQGARREAGGRYTTVESDVLSVTPALLLPDTVYNIEVEGNNNYFAGGILVHNCEHLEAIEREEIVDGDVYNRLLINVPPGMMKSMLVSVFFPAWIWGPKNKPHMRFLCASHNIALAERDNTRMRRLVTSEWYAGLWGDRVQLSEDQNAKLRFENTATGWRTAVAAGGLTGWRADIVIIDDPHSVKGGESDAERETVNTWFRETVPTRLNRPDASAIIVVMQRIHENDVSGVILDGELGYDHIMLPMRFDPDRANMTRLGFEDPREERDELLFPDRFPLSVVERDERIMGPYAVAGQFQQSPTPRGGGVIKDVDWVLWSAAEYPPLDFIVASLDTAYTEKTTNDYSALTIWGVFSGHHDKGITRVLDRYGKPFPVPRSTGIEGMSKVVLMFALQERLEFNALIKRVAEVCKLMKVDRILVEGKASGISVAQELRRLYASAGWAVHLINPGAQDKMARLNSVQHLFTEGMVYAPDKTWAEMVIRQTASFPKAKHDDLVDTVSQAIRHLRDAGLLVRADERLDELANEMNFANVQTPPPLYAV